MSDTIILPYNAVENERVIRHTPIHIGVEMQRVSDRTFHWFWKLWCRIFGHKIITYNGGYYYSSYKNGVPYGGRKGREKRPLRCLRHKVLKEGYCAHCGKHFTNTYIKKHKI